MYINQLLIFFVLEVLVKKEKVTKNGLLPRCKLTSKLTSKLTYNGGKYGRGKKWKKLYSDFFGFPVPTQTDEFFRL